MVEVAVFLVVGVDANSQGAILQGGAAIDCGIAPLQCGQLGGGRQKLLTAGAFDDVVDGAARRVEAVEEARRSLQNVDPLDVLEGNVLIGRKRQPIAAQRVDEIDREAAQPQTVIFSISTKRTV